MLSERVDGWIAGWKLEGRQQGMQKCEGLLLQKLLTRRFALLPVWFIEQIAQATQEDCGLRIAD